MISNTYKINEYSIITSLDKSIFTHKEPLTKEISTTPIIYIKIINNNTYQCFEDYININDINLPFNNENKYSIISKCFNNNNNNYIILFYNKKNIINLDFDILFNNEYRLKFNINLKEVILNNNYKKTLNYRKIEEENSTKIRKLENKIEQLDEIINSLINMDYLMYTTNPNPGATNYHNCIKLNSYEINIGDSSYSMTMLNKIEFFYQLNKITLFGSYNYSNIQFSNKSVKILCIKTEYITSLENLDKLPLLEVIEIYSSGLLNINNIIPFLHKNIKKISFLNNNIKLFKEKLTSYCTDNNIEITFA